MTMEESESNIVLLNFKSSLITIPGFLSIPALVKFQECGEGSGKGVNEIGAGTKHPVVYEIFIENLCYYYELIKRRLKIFRNRPKIL